MNRGWRSRRIPAKSACLVTFPAGVQDALARDEVAKG
jgi:hypothetical protein